MSSSENNVVPLWTLSTRERALVYLALGDALVYVADDGCEACFAKLKEDISNALRIIGAPDDAILQRVEDENQDTHEARK